MFSDKLFSDDVFADMPVSVHEEVPLSALQIFMEEGVPLVSPVIDRIVRRSNDELVFMDRRMGEVSVLSREVWDPLIQSDTWDVRLSHGDTEWFCLLYSAGSGSVGNETMAIRLDGQGLDHCRGVVWDPGIVGQQCVYVCYDCLCLMALFREVMLSVIDWAAWSFWTGTESGYCRTITWELGYLGSINPPCDVDRLFDRNAWQIKEIEVVVTADRSDNNRFQRCACVRGTSLGVLSAGRIMSMVIGLVIALIG